MHRSSLRVLLKKILIPSTSVEGGSSRERRAPVVNLLTESDRLTAFTTASWQIARLQMRGNTGKTPRESQQRHLSARWTERLAIESETVACVQAQFLHCNTVALSEQLGEYPFASHA